MSVCVWCVFMCSCDVCDSCVCSCVRCTSRVSLLTWRRAARSSASCLNHHALGGSLGVSCACLSFKAAHTINNFLSSAVTDKLGCGGQQSHGDHQQIHGKNAPTAPADLTGRHLGRLRQCNSPRPRALVVGCKAESVPAKKGVITPATTT